MSDQQPPGFGPSGYLPERASKRARKIVLRAPLGLQWVVASLVAGLVVVVAGLVFLRTAGGPPGDPFVAVGPVEEVGDASYHERLGVLLVGAAGRIRTFEVGDDQIRFCAQSRRLESAGGRVWSLTGRGLDGQPSLDTHPTTVVDGIVYVDPTTVVEGPPPADEHPTPACDTP